MRAQHDADPWRSTSDRDRDPARGPAVVGGVAVAAIAIRDRRDRRIELDAVARSDRRSAPSAWPMHGAARSSALSCIGPSRSRRRLAAGAPRATSARLGRSSCLRECCARRSLADPRCTACTGLRRSAVCDLEESSTSSSRGWTRTNNPPVNSRMLCQLSYAGRPADCSGAGRGHASSRIASLTRASCVCSSFIWSNSASRELPAQPALAQVQEQLLARPLVESLPRRARVELGPEREQVALELAALDEVRAEAAVQLGVEVLGRELREQLHERRDARRTRRARSARAARPSRAASARAPR